ncbi:MAG: nitrogen fixation protein FixH [Ideonella sp.]|nr:nitrogen fixation protein FixH [Ideonella sp.]
MNPIATRRPLAVVPADAAPWWRVPMVWVVIGGPLAVVIASLLTAAIAWRHIDPVILDAGTGQVIGRAGDDVPVPVDPKDALAPAQRARNHSATPAHD